MPETSRTRRKLVSHHCLARFGKSWAVFDGTNFTIKCKEVWDSRPKVSTSSCSRQAFFWWHQPGTKTETSAHDTNFYFKFISKLYFTSNLNTKPMRHPRCKTRTLLRAFSDLSEYDLPRFHYSYNYSNSTDLLTAAQLLWCVISQLWCCVILLMALHEI